MKKLLASWLGILVAVPIVQAQNTVNVPAGTPVTITVSPATPAPPPASFNLLDRHGHVTPLRSGFNHTGGGYIDVAQPTPDVLVITMTGVAVAGAHPCKDSVATMQFDLNQNLEVSFDDPKLKKAKVTMEGRLIGLLRSQASHKDCKRGCGTAEVSAAHAGLVADAGAEIVTLSLPPHAVAGGENLSLNDHSGPVEAPIVAGKFTLHQQFCITAAHAQSILPCKAASAEFAPDPALDPLWISYWEPFHGVGKKDFGFQITLKIAEDKGTEEKKPEPVAPPTPK